MAGQVEYPGKMQEPTQSQLNLLECVYWRLCLQVVDYILKGGDREAFLKHFSKAVSAGFDPDQDLDRVGLANQVRAEL